jgi:Flp pilus assembly protein TadB
MGAHLILVMILAAMVGACVVVAVAWSRPADVDLTAAFARITPTRAGRRADQHDAAKPEGRERLGLWAARTLPAGLWGKTPTRELALLRIPLTRFYAEKLTFAVLGLLIPPLLGAFFMLLGLELPFVIPAAAGLALGAAMFFIPNYNAIDDAKTARAEFRRALSAYIDLVATERHNGAGARQAMESAAEVSNSWVFTRLAEELRRSRWSGVPPWDALRALSDELGLPELADFADIMRLSGAEGAAVYTNLRARSAALRSAMLGEELTAANAVGERMSIPGSLLGVIFMALLLAPAILGMLTTT